MAWDLEFKNGDLTGGIATGDDEVIQRIGATLRDKSTVDLLIRKRILETEGVARAVKLNTLFSIGSRTYSVYMQVLLHSGSVVEDTLTIGGEDENGV